MTTGSKSITRRTSASVAEDWLAPSPELTPLAARAARFAVTLWLRDPTIRGRLADRDFVSAFWLLLRPLIHPERVDVIQSLTPDEDDDHDWDSKAERLGGPALRRMRQWLEIIPQLVAARLNDLAADEEVHSGIAMLHQALWLTETERALLDFAWVRDESPIFREFLRECQTATLRTNRRRLACLTGEDSRNIHRALSVQGLLKRLDLINESRIDTDLEDYITTSKFFSNLLDANPTSEWAVLEFLVEPLPRPRWGLAEFPHLATTAKRLMQTLGAAAQSGQVGVNGLLYGPAGAGKTEFAAVVAQAAGLTAWRVKSKDEDDNGLDRNGRMSAYLLAQRLLASRRDALIVFDEVEDVFGGEGMAHLAVLLSGETASGKDKGFMNRSLEENTVPALWITNDAQSMDPAFLRRFLLPVAFNTPPKAVRRRMVEAHLADYGVPDELLDVLAADEKLQPAQFDAARRLLKLNPDANPVEHVRESISAQRRLLHGSALPHRRQRPLQVDIAYLNVAGSVSPGQLLAALERRGRGTLCLYGPPGTGKTEFAHLVADALGRELIVRRASDLKSKWVGETESRIAATFNEIDPERTVLLIDEIDSFLRDRRRAEKSWEVSEVNELLQQMEDYPGIFIAATNLMSQIDEAALRRFDFKLAFQPLQVSQRLKLFAREALGDEMGEVPAVLADRIARLEGLTTGDFANVVRQYVLLEETLAPPEFLTRLAAELRRRTSTL